MYDNSFNDFHNQHTTHTAVLFTGLLLQTDTANRRNSQKHICLSEKMLTHVYEHIKVHVISQMSLQHNTSYTMFS